MAQGTAKAEMADRPQQTSLFLKLPIELRIMIYDLALQDILDDLAKPGKNQISSSVNDRKLPLPLLGALAMFHTCHELRGEATDAMRSVAEVKVRNLDAADSASARISMLTSTNYDFEKRKKRISAYWYGIRLCKTLEKLAQGQLLFRLSRLRGNLPWSKLKHEEKLQEVDTWFYELTRQERMSLYMSMTYSGTIMEALVDFVDKGVELTCKGH